MSRDEKGALHTAYALLAGRPLKITTESLFARLGVAGFSQRDLDDVRRGFDSARIGNAAEKLDKAAPGRDKLIAALRLARAVRPCPTDRKPGWFRFLLTLGKSKSDTAFQLSYARRFKSSAAQPKFALDRAVQIPRHVSDMLVAGSILTRTKANGANGQPMKVVHAIGSAINAGEIATDEEAAQKAWHRFRKSCEKETGGRNTYRLEQYEGSIMAYRGRWVALPASGAGLPRLPSPKGGRPRKTA